MVRLRAVPRTRMVTPRAFTTLTTSYAYTKNASGLHQTVVSANFAPDPFGTESDNKPRGFSEYAAFYSRVMVHQFKVTVKAVNLSDTLDCMVSMVTTAGVSASDTSIFRTPEYADQSNRIALRGGQNVVVMSRSGDVAKIYGVRTLDLTDFSCPTDATGMNKAVFVNIFNDSFTGSGASHVRIMVTIQQRVQFFDPIPVTAT